MDVPTEADWRSEPWGLETPSAYQNFFDKTLAEAIELLESDAILYAEDIDYMPLPCFLFYIHAYMDYLLSDKSQGDSVGASGFYGFISSRRKDLQSDEHLLEKTKLVLEHLKNHQDWYDADPDNFGDFAEKTRRGLKLLRKP